MDTAIKKQKSRWLRGADPSVPELDRILDAYWGGPERRISMLTVRIIGMNAIAMILLMVGILSLGEYRETLIEARLENFNNEVVLMAEALGEYAIEDGNFIKVRLNTMVRRLAHSGAARHIRIFNKDGLLFLDSRQLRIEPFIESDPKPLGFLGIEALNEWTDTLLQYLPHRRSLPDFPDEYSDYAEGYPGASEALQGEYSLKAWEGSERHILLSSSGPLVKDGQIFGSILVTRDAHDISEEIANIWFSIIAAFFITLMMTVLVSIYLSGAITAPLKKLAKAADGVRKGQMSVEDIPDFGDRNDEIGELSSSFKDMMNALWDRMDSIERFSADVAHELKNPMTSLKSAVETMGIVKKDEDRTRLLEVIRHDIDRMDRLISDISHASRLDSELSRDVFQRVDINKLLHNLLEAYQDPLERGKGPADIFKFEGITIRLENIDGDQSYVWGLENRLEQVFQNLVANAISFSKAEDTITVSIYHGKRRVRITVEDEGPGIPDKNLDSIFERFYTERPSHEGYGNHSGLGLSICKQIVTALGGEIYAENISDEKGTDQNGGARFIVTLKAA